ncbi:MAG TPA: AraC family transcriptional regulator [Ktedonobacteraceae bacterium]|nr:AraC family transcriptional regulator [Ktedonobacteraceae bacterium]
MVQAPTDNWDQEDVERMAGALQKIAQELADPFFAELLFDQLADVVFFIKDLAGRYVVVNRTLMLRCGFQHKSELLGHAPQEVFPVEFGMRYADQDRDVLKHGQFIHNQLELHLYTSRRPGWCLTDKIPLLDREGRVIGLAGISRDLRVPDQDHPTYQRVADVVSSIQRRYAEPLRLEELAAIVQVSVAQLERYMQRIFDLTPKQLIIKTRIEAAARLLEGEQSVAEIAYACGYTDHSAFSRQFKVTTGLSPTAYRELRRGGDV